MSILDSLPATIGSAFSSLFRDATLSRVSTRVSDGRGGWTETIVSDACKALVTDYTDWQRQAAGIPASERRIIVLASTLESGMKPKTGDEITIQGRAWSIVEVTSDPANATYECRSR